MRGDLFINGVDAYTEYGVSMGDGFLDALNAPYAMKDYITNESRLKDGVDVIASVRKKESREVTLAFNLERDTAVEFETSKAAFLAVLYGGKVTITTRRDNVGHVLVYTGKSITYAEEPLGNFCTLSAKFIEPLGTIRTT